MNLSGNSLGKWWSLQLAAMAQPGMDELMSPRETERELAKALVMALPPEPVAAAKPKKGLAKLFSKKPPDATAPKKRAMTPAASWPLEEYARILPRKDRAEILARVSLDLTQLALRAHPLYRSVLGQYQSLLKSLTNGKKEKEAAGELAALANLRRNLLRDMQGIEDYLDWHEATQSRGLSGSFDEYLRAAAELAQPRAPRRDALSRYMNLMEQEYLGD